MLAKINTLDYLIKICYNNITMTKNYKPILNPAFREKVCIDCGNPFYARTQHFKRRKRCTLHQLEYENKIAVARQRAKRHALKQK